MQTILFSAVEKWFLFHLICLSLSVSSCISISKSCKNNTIPLKYRIETQSVKCKWLCCNTRAKNNAQKDVLLVQLFLNTRLKNLNSWAWELRPHAAGNDAHADRVHCVVSFIEDGAVVLTFYTCSTKALTTQWIWTQDPLDPSAAQSQQPISV